MRTNYSSWSSKRLSIENLKLDVNNPRFSYQSTKEMNQTEIVKFLIANHSVYDLAKSIAVNGYLLNEQPIVCKEGDSYVVLEGNRRIAACKVILNPYKYLTPQRAKELSKYGRIDEKIQCHIAPTRRDADTLIYNKHTGIPLQKWDKVSQDAFLCTLLKHEDLSVEDVARRLSVSTSEIRKALRRHSIHQYCIDLFSDEPYELEQIKEQGFPITNFERFYDDERGLKFLGLTFGSNGEILKCLPVEEFDRRFRFIVLQILSQELTSRTFNNEKDKEEYFSAIKRFDKERFDLDVEVSYTPIPSTNENNIDEKVNEKEDQDEGKKTKRLRRKSGLFDGYDWSSTGVNKLDKLFLSLKELNYKRHTDMAGISLRCYVDMMVYEFLKSKRHIGEVIKEDFRNASVHNDRKFGELKQYLKTTFALGDEEINDDELRVHSRFSNKETSSKIPELGNMIAYVIVHPELLDNDTRMVQVLKEFKKNSNGFVDLTACNMFVHNQYFSASVSNLENCANTLAPVLDAMYKCIVNDV